MQAPRTVTFVDRSTVAAYDEFQVPTLSRPWARLLVDGFADWTGLTVVDLATGSGIVAEILSPHVGPEGRIIGVDVSATMLALARQRCAGTEATVTFRASSADRLDLPDGSVDVVVCQQGFQFFQDRAAVAAEAHRVLGPGGTLITTTWCSLAECDYFLAVRDALVEIGEPGLAALLDVPFERMPADELVRHVLRAGFEDVRVDRRELPLTFEGGMEQAIATAGSTVVGPELAKMNADEQRAFRVALETRLRELTDDGHTVGRTASHVLTARTARGPSARADDDPGR